MKTKIVIMACLTLVCLASCKKESVQQTIVQNALDKEAILLSAAQTASFNDSVFVKQKIIDFDDIHVLETIIDSTAHYYASDGTEITLDERKMYDFLADLGIWKPSVKKYTYDTTYYQLYHYKYKMTTIRNRTKNDSIIYSTARFSNDSLLIQVHTN